MVIDGRASTLSVPTAEDWRIGRARMEELGKPFRGNLGDGDARTGPSSTSPRGQDDPPLKVDIADAQAAYSPERSPDE